MTLMLKRKLKIPFFSQKIPVSFSFKFEVSPSKKNVFYMLQGKLCKSDDKFFIFHLKSSFRFKDI